MRNGLDMIRCYYRNVALQDLTVRSIDDLKKLDDLSGITPTLPLPPRWGGNNF